MDEELQKDIFSILKKHNRYDLISMIMNLIEEIDSDYESSDEEEEPYEEYFEGGAIPEDPSYCISDDGFHYLS
jgi:hypothetical protein